MASYMPLLSQGGAKMSKDVSKSFDEHFGKLKDPRIDRTKLYPLVEILLKVLCGYTNPDTRLTLYTHAAQVLYENSILINDIP
jgi:hypothetical protein